MSDDPTRPARRSPRERPAGARIDIVTAHPTPSLAVVSVSGELDLTTGAQLDACLDHELDAPGTTDLIIDLSRLRLLAARGITSLVRVDEDARARDIAVRVVVSRPIDRVLAVLELDRHLHTHPDLDSARRSTA